MEQAWRDRIAAFERLDRWEIEAMRQQPTNLARSLEWLSDAWELIDRYGSAEATDREERRIEEMLELKRALERARLAP